MDVMEKIQQQVDSAAIVIYMKGTPQFPQCGFSATVIQILDSLTEDYQTVDVLADPEVGSQPA